MLPDGAGKDRLELDFQLALGPCLIATQGPASNKAMATFARARELCERLGDPPEHLRVMFWLTTASVVRGELPLAQEMIVALLQLTEARGDRPALLNAMRGQAMILPFHGACQRCLRIAGTGRRGIQRKQRGRKIGGSCGWPGCWSG